MPFWFVTFCAKRAKMFRKSKLKLALIYDPSGCRDWSFYIITRPSPRSCYCWYAGATASGDVSVFEFFREVAS
jgi:hypothetical protein